MNSRKKIIDNHSTLKRIILRWRKIGKTIAFTNGCFDILHFGHVRYLEEAKKPNRILVVGINSDSSVRKIKGKNRPIVSQCERTSIIAALECVDYVTIFHETTPLHVIKTLEPDILVKGADWKGREVVGGDFVKSKGGRVELIKYLKPFSTTRIIKTIAQKCAK